MVTLSFAMIEYNGYNDNDDSAIFIHDEKHPLQRYIFAVSETETHGKPWKTFC